MRQSALYALDDVVLEVDSQEPGQEIARLLAELSWVVLRRSDRKPTLYLSVRSSSGRFSVPQICREALRTDDFLGYELADNFFLTDGSSVFHLRPQLGQAHARIVPSFFAKPSIVRTNFWCFGLLKLLRPLGIYSLHGAGLSNTDGEGVLLIGPSGSGKSTLAIGLIRAGWSYLSDDAVFLRAGSESVEALACRKSFYIDAARSAQYSDFSLGEEEPDANGGQRRRVSINKAYPEQYIAECSPRVMIFTKITARPHSALTPIDRLSALRLLLAQSAPQLFDRSTMPGQLELLKKLLQQAEIYQLDAGEDLHLQPAKLVDHIREARGATHCLASSLS
jgi:hypothetical protein